MRLPLAANLAAAILAALAAPLAACSSSVDKTGMATRGFYSPSFDTVWEVSQTEMQRQGFPPDMEESSKETKTLVSRYSVALHPFYGRGFREKATVTLHEVPSAPNRWVVEVNVLREVNSEMKQPTNPLAADWEDGVRVPEKERMMASGIESFFIGHDVSPEFRAIYGMPAAPRVPKEDSKFAKPGDKPEDDWTQHTR